MADAPAPAPGLDDEGLRRRRRVLMIAFAALLFFSLAASSADDDAAAPPGGGAAPSPEPDPKIVRTAGGLRRARARACAAQPQQCAQ